MAIYTGNSPIVGPSTPVDLDDLAEWIKRQGAYRQATIDDYLITLADGCLVLGFDFVVMAAQWDLETDTGRSSWWRDRLNPAGLGVTGDPAQNAVSQTWASGHEAALGHLAHMAAYVYGDNTVDHWPESWPDVVTVDRRFGAPIRAGYHADTLADLNGTWAIDAQNDYGGKLAARANRIVSNAGTPVVTIPPGNGEMPMAESTFGRVPHPPFKDMIVSKVGGGGFDSVPPREIVGGVHHETMGRGTIEFYAEFFGCPNGERCGNALVDYVIGRDGRIGRLNDPRGTRSPWASGGGVGLPGGLEGDGPAFVAKFGVSAINGRNVSIEYEKLNNEPLTPEQIQSGGALMAHFHDSDEQPWDRHPFVPKYGCVVSFLHWEFGTTDCGKDMVDDLAAIQAVTKGIMRQHQTGGGSVPGTTSAPAPRYAKPSPIPGLVDMGERAVVHTDGFAFIQVNDQVRALRDTPRLRHADPDADRVGPVIKAGEEFRVRWIFEAADGRMYYITPFWTRVLVEDTERVRDAA